jgi:hypothetical protein
MRSPFRTLGSTSEDCKDKGFRGRAALQRQSAFPRKHNSYCILIRSDARPRINVKGIIYESVVWRTNATCLLTLTTCLTSYSVYTTSERTATALDRERGCLHVLCT